MDVNGVRLERSQMNGQQRNNHKNKHGSRNILLHTISYSEYEKITNKDYAKSIFDSLLKTHEKNKQMKKTKALDLIQKDEVFMIGEDRLRMKVIYVASKIRTL